MKACIRDTIHQQKCKNVVQYRVNSDAGALLRCHGIDARCIGRAKTHWNSVRALRAIAIGAGAQQCIPTRRRQVGMHCNIALNQVPDGVGFRRAQVSHMITSPFHLRTQRSPSGWALTRTLDVIHHIVHQSTPLASPLSLKHHFNST